MAKRIKVAEFSFEISDNNTLKIFAGETKKAGKELKNVEKQQQKTTYATQKGINATANSTKNFANMARGISSSLVPAYATLAANVFALTAVFGFLKQAADFRVLQQGQEAYAAVTGIGYKTLTNTIIEATDAQITFADAAQAAAIGTAAGLSPEQLGKLGEAAKTVSIALGRDLTDSFNRLIRGTTKAEPELLDELGIVLRLETATKNYADKLGVAKESLNAFQRTQAVTDDVLGQVETKFAAINAIIDPQTNKINKLAKSFDDLMNKLREFIGPIAEGLATFFSENLLAAVGALGLFVLPIIQGILPAFDELAKGAEIALNKHNAKLEEARTQLNAYRDTSKMAQAQAVKTFASLQTKAQELAQSAGLPAGRKGSGLRNLQEGKNISARQAAAIKKQVSNTESIYFISNNKIRKDFIRTMESMVTADKVKNGRIKAQVKGLELFINKSSAAMRVGFQAAMAGMTKAGAVAGAAISKAFGIFSTISITLLAFEGMREGLRKFGLLETAADGANTALGKLAKTQKDLNVELQKMLDADEKLAAEGLDLTMSQLIKRQGDRLTTAALGPSLKALAENRKEQAALRAGGALTDADIQKLQVRALPGTPGGSAILKQIRAANEDTEGKKQLSDLVAAETDFVIDLEERITKLSKTFPQFKSMLKDGKLVATELTAEQFGLVDAYRQGAAAVKSLEQGEAAYNQALRSRFGAVSKERATQLLVEKRILDLRTKMKSPEFKAGSPAEQAAARAELSSAELFGETMESSDKKQRAAKEAADRAKTQQAALQNRIHGATILGKRQKVLLDITTKQVQIDSVRAQIAERQALLDAGMAKDPLAAQRGIDDLEEQVRLLNQQKIGLENSINLTRELGVVATETFANSMQKGIQGVIEGTMSIKDAFKDMAKSILQSLAQVLAKMLTMRILSSTFGIPMADGGVIPMGRGGVIKGYQHGGIAREPTYLVGEAGPEAVVPLPDGRSIPVQMSGATGNNITINVDASGNATTTMDGERGQALGMAIQAAVMETIQREKRPGGVLGGG